MNEQWKEIIKENNVIELLAKGKSFKEVAGELKDKGYNCTADSLRMGITRLGYTKSKNQDLYYKPEQKEYINFMNSVDVEVEIETIAAKRYYDCCFDNGYYYRENIKYSDIAIDKQIFDEVEELAEKYGCSAEEYIICLLLQDLDQEKPVNKTREFAYKRLLESNRFSNEEKLFILAKENQGYNLYDMVVVGYHENIMKMSEEEFAETISTEKEIEPYV